MNNTKHLRKLVQYLQKSATSFCYRFFRKIFNIFLHVMTDDIICVKLLASERLQNQTCAPSRTPLLNWRLSQNSIISWGKNVTTFALDISSTIPRISHSVMHKQSWLLLLLGPSVGRYSQIRSKNSLGNPTQKSIGKCRIPILRNASQQKREIELKRAVINTDCQILRNT